MFNIDVWYRGRAYKFFMLWLARLLQARGGGGDNDDDDDDNNNYNNNNFFQ